MSHRLALLGAALRSSLVTEGTEGASSPMRTFAASVASLGGRDARDGGEVPVAPPGADDFQVAGPVPKNESRVRESLKAIAGRVAEAVRGGATPLLFGGDATVLLGLLAGIHDGSEAASRLSLVDLDGLARFQSADDAPGGDLSRMVLGLAIGRGPPSMTHLARDRFPLVQDTDVLLAGVRDATASEAATLVRSRITLVTPDRLQGRVGEGQFMAALGTLSHRVRDVVVQLDASVLDPRQFGAAAGTPSPGGLTLEGLKRIAGQLASWSSDGTVRLRGLSVSGVDVRKDPGGAGMHELARLAVRTFGTP